MGEGRAGDRRSRLVGGAWTIGSFALLYVSPTLFRMREKKPKRNSPVARVRERGHQRAVSAGKAEKPHSCPWALAGISSPEEVPGAEGAASGQRPQEGVCLTCRTPLPVGAPGQGSR